MTNDNDRRLPAKQVADMLGFTTTNLKHYASLLEQQGLKVFRNSRNHREYSEHDVKLLRAMQVLNRDKSMLLEDAASLVTASDTDIDAILAPKMASIIATDDSYKSEVSQDVGSAERVLAHLSTLMADNRALREELQARDKLNIEFQSDISDKMTKQARIIADQSEALEAMSAELERIRKIAEAKPSLWTRLFGK